MLFRRIASLILLCCYLLTATRAIALPTIGDIENDQAKPGQVSLPLEHYNQLVSASQNPLIPPRAAPAQYALGKANLSASFNVKDERVSAHITATLDINVFEDQWTAVAILPLGSAITRAEVNGLAVGLMNGADGVSWGVKKAGSYKMLIEYDVDAAQYENGYSLAIPTPRAAATTIVASIPGSGIEAAVIPSAGTKITPSGESTRLEAAVPSTSMIQLSWRTSTKETHVLSRARYSGHATDKAVHWKSEFDLQLFMDTTVRVFLFPKSMVLKNIQVDGVNAPILEEQGKFGTLLKGAGLHTITAEFETPVSEQAGATGILLLTPAVPVSTLELELPGKKELIVEPASSVQTTFEKDSTQAIFHLAMTNQVRVNWTEAVPEEVKTDVRSNADIYHLVFAEEGVLDVRAIVAYEVTRGETSVIAFTLPGTVQVNSVTDAGGEIADWKVEKDEKSGQQQLTVFLKRKLAGSLTLNVHYDSSLLGLEQDKDIRLPFLTPDRVHRQRGMVALLSGKEFSLKPVGEEQLSRVGENQLPEFVRKDVKLTVAHTYKYVSPEPTLSVVVTEPERKEGKFDAVIDTLISLSDVAMKGSASVLLNVKSGTINKLELLLPADINVLSLTSPSLRNYKTSPADDGQQIAVQFTQEMEGEFRIQLGYEFIVTDEKGEFQVPTVAVAGAEVEQGRIAVEALSAVEVLPGKAERLSLLDIGELPRQLLLQTTNPILLAYKYVHRDPAFDLSLRVIRHDEIPTQAAAIDTAAYKTLITEDGLAVTAAHFMVRNSREQFLRISLPKDAKVWSLFVDGKAEKPAVAEAKNGSHELLVKIITSDQGFPIELVYQSKVSEMEIMGTIASHLPNPDMIVTDSRWEVYLPEEFSYGKPDTNMELLDSGSTITPNAMRSMVDGWGNAKGEANAPQTFRIQVPSAGVRYVFGKLYANQSAEPAAFTISYTSSWAGILAYGFMCLGTLLFWLGVLSPVVAGAHVERRTAGLAAASGALLLFGTALYLRLNPLPALVITVALITVAAGVLLQRAHQKRRANYFRQLGSSSSSDN